VLSAASASEWWRASPDRRRVPQVERSDDGTLVYLDRVGRRWHVYDRRAGERRVETRELSRLFVGDNGERRECAVSPEEAESTLPEILERQFLRAERV
jgi:hypothetical protein